MRSSPLGRPTAPIALLLGALLCSPAAAQTGEPLAQRRPNVLVIVMDDVAERDLDRLPTPRIDALAATGLRFRRAYGAPSCSAARRALHAGEYADTESGSPCRGTSPYAPSTARPSLPRLFSDAGYATGLFGKWHLGGYPEMEDGAPWELAPQAHGYDVWRAGILKNVKNKLCGGRDYELWLRAEDGMSGLERAYVPFELRDAFLGWRAEVRAQDSPWFAMLCFQLPHAPYHVPPGQPPASTPRGKYERMTATLDELIGEVLDAVADEPTIVVLVGDNGTPRATVAPGQSGSKAKGTTYEDGIRVPMIWHGPGVPRGAETHAIVHLVDLLPTFAQLLGAAPTDLVGRSLAPILREPTRGVHEYVWSGHVSTNVGVDHAVVTQRWKYRTSTVEGRFLFDLHADPAEEHNLSGRPDLALLEQRLALLAARHPTARR